MLLQGLCGEMIDEEDAVEVIDLMLRGTGQQSLGLEIKSAAGEILTDDANAGWAIHLIL